MIEVGRVLVQHDGADILVMGCAGMTRHRAALQEALKVPVIDPTSPRSVWRSASAPFKQTR